MRKNRLALIRRRHFQDEIILLCVRYLQYSLSYRDLEEMMAERGLSVVHVTVAGQRTYLYRAVDSEGDTIDFMLSPNRDLKKMKSSWSNDSGRRVRSAGAI